MSIYKTDSKTTLYSNFCSEKEYLEMLEAAIEESDIGFLIADAAGKVIKVNQAHITITNQEAEYNVGRNMRDIQIEDGSPSATVKALETQEPVTLEQHLSNGKSYLVYTHPHFDGNNRLQYVFSNLLDTTGINKTIEEIREDNRRLSLQLTELQNQMDSHTTVIHQSAIMRKLILLCDKVAQFDSALLLQGESGVGKERIAQYIFEKSQRKNKSFLKINCAAIPENLLESELFGYAPGAFTGADQKGKKGLLEYADGGTILFDEISELALPLQAKLLRFLQNGEFYRLGESKVTYANVRIIAAANRDLQELVKKELFREDLFYRLNVIPILVPPLRKRREDIPLLIGYFTGKFNEKYGLNKSFHIRAVSYLSTLGYQGNVRELENAVERFLVLSDEDNIKEATVRRILEGVRIDEEVIPPPPAGSSLKEMVAAYEVQVIEHYMKRYGTEKSAGRQLGVSQSTISRKLSRRLG